MLEMVKYLEVVAVVEILHYLEDQEQTGKLLCSVIR